MTTEPRAASWSAPALWRFGRARRRKRPPGRARSPAKSQMVAVCQHRPMAVWGGRTGQWAFQFPSGESMNDFHKCKCPHCGQSIDYPADGMGQTVPCPTCEQPFPLLPAVKIPCKKKLENTLPPAPEFTTARTSAQELETNVAGQPKTEWEEWIALNERLAERRIKSGIPLSDESPAVRKSAEIIPAASNPPPVQEYREPRPLFASLSEATISKATKSGEIPLHRAAKMGRINEIPKHLLTVQLFMAKDNSFDRKTPVHLAAKFGQLV